MQARPEAPPDWSQLQWHRAPGRARYKSRATAERACRWLNANEHSADYWLYRPGGTDPGGKRWFLERRWIG
jgi:hypothetical protein